MWKQERASADSPVVSPAGQWPENQDSGQGVGGGEKMHIRCFKVGIMAVYI